MTEKETYFCHAGIYNPVLHVPMIMSMPVRLPENVRVNAVTSGLDVFPTVLEIIGVKYPDRLINRRSPEIFRIYRLKAL